MLDAMHDLGVTFRRSPAVIDYHSELPETGKTGRALEPDPFDGRLLDKADFAASVRRYPSSLFLGGTLMLRRADVSASLEALQRLACSARQGRGSGCTTRPAVGT